MMLPSDVSCALAPSLRRILRLELIMIWQLTSCINNRPFTKIGGKTFLTPIKKF